MSYYCRTVNDVKNLGYKIKVFHNRFKNVVGGLNHKGGSTEVHITDNLGNTVKGFSQCHENDPFVKRIGIAIAIGRALKSM
jgi:hypothetical protein